MPATPEAMSIGDAHVHRAIQRGRAVAAGALQLRNSGYRPDVICAHIGWGEALFLKDVFPDSPLLLYCEFFYGAAERGFDPQISRAPDDDFRVRLWNAPFLVALDACDWGVAPTRWQRSQFPAAYARRISTIHDGVDTDAIIPGEPPRDEELITYTAPNLEPYRGFHIFMRAIPEIQKRRPQAKIVIVGGDEIKYSPPLPQGTYRQIMLAEMGSRIDLSRVQFIKWLPYEQYLALLRRSSVHVYLTYPFVLSWSVIEAMASGCLIVASRTPPVEEVITDGKNGLLVDFFAPEQIAARIDEALRGKDAMQPIRDAARRTAVEGFDLKRVCLPAQVRLVEQLASGQLPTADGQAAFSGSSPRSAA
jgi:glycosyltransferase involved in cell wall biosynthesis